MSEKDTAQQKRENYIDKYSKTKAFKELDKDKQEAILSLKTLQAEPMPKGINTQELQNLITHFDNKHDKAQREFYLKFFEDTKQNPHIELNVLGKNGEQRKEYIKAYQHKESKDLYYIVITQENDNINITGYPTTKISKVINDIAKSENVARTLDEIAPPAKPIENNPSHQLANNIMPQKNNIVKVFHANKKNIKYLKRLYKKDAVYKQSVVGSLNSYTQAQSLDERLVDNNSSPTANESISQKDKTSIQAKNLRNKR